MVDIQYKDGKYIINATIQTEISTLDITKVREYFICDCEAEFAEAIRSMVTENAILRKAIKEQMEIENNEND